VSSRDKGKGRAVSPAPVKPAKPTGKAGKAKRSSKGEISEERRAVIAKLFDQFTADPVSKRKGSIGIEGVRAVAQLVGDIHWNDAEVSPVSSARLVSPNGLHPRSKRCSTTPAKRLISA
jgi:hypothetical protein